MNHINAMEDIDAFTIPGEIANVNVSYFWIHIHSSISEINIDLLKFPTYAADF